MIVSQFLIEANGAEMSERKEAMTARERFLQLAQEEMSAFERNEMEFQRKDRQERAKQFRISPDVKNPRWFP
jgi:hypothetical protein